MSSQSKTVTTNSKKTGNWALRNTELVLTLPPPEHEWAWYDLPDRPDTPDPFPEGFLEMLNTFKTNNVIKKVGVTKTKRPNGSTDYRTLWSVVEEVWRFAAKEHTRKLQSGETLPCGHRSGFVTLDSEKGVYECGYRFCEETYDREAIERVEF